LWGFTTDRKFTQVGLRLNIYIILEMKLMLIKMEDRLPANKKQNEFVNRLNKAMPKIPSMEWGALTNIHPTNAKLKEINRLLPHDSKWHMLFEDEDEVNVDGVPIRRKTLDSMT
jgi:hypothetical protein